MRDSLSSGYLVHSVPVTSKSNEPMPVLKTLVESDIKARFHQLARASGLSESELLRAVVLERLGERGSSVSTTSVNEEESDTARMTIRMRAVLMDAAKARAKTKGMAPSRWVAALVQSNLMCDPVMNEEELVALNASSRELIAIGRNINQMTKSLHEHHYDTESVRLAALAELSEAIKHNRAAIRAVVRASQNAWEVAKWR